MIKKSPPDLKPSEVMNMTSNKTVHEAFKNILLVKNSKEKTETIASMIQLNIMHEVYSLMQTREMNKAQLAEKLGVSKSYITQLFSADKSINLKLIAQIQDIFEVKFNASFQDKRITTHQEVKTHPCAPEQEYYKPKGYTVQHYTADESIINFDINSSNSQHIHIFDSVLCSDKIESNRMIS